MCRLVHVGLGLPATRAAGGHVVAVVLLVRYRPPTPGMAYWHLTHLFGHFYFYQGGGREDAGSSVTGCESSFTFLFTTSPAVAVRTERR